MLLKYVARLHAYLERRDNAKSFWQGIMFQEKQTQSSRDNYTRIVKE